MQATTTSRKWDVPEKRRILNLQPRGCSGPGLPERDLSTWLQGRW